MNGNFVLFYFDVFRIYLKTFLIGMISPCLFEIYFVGIGVLQTRLNCLASVYSSYQMNLLFKNFVLPFDTCVRCIVSFSFLVYQKHLVMLGPTILCVHALWMVYFPGSGCQLVSAPTVKQNQAALSSIETWPSICPDFGAPIRIMTSCLPMKWPICRLMMPVPASWTSRSAPIRRLSRTH